jgi:hypothetical protein
VKTLILVLISTTALTGFGAAAQAGEGNFDGFVGLSAGVVNYDTAGPFPDNADAVALEALVTGAYGFTPTLGMQGDLVLHGETVDDEGLTTDVREYDAALHAFYREEGSFLIGGILQATHSDYGATNPLDNLFYGAEAQFYAGNATFYLQAGGLRSTYGDEISHGAFGTGEFRYYVDPNLKLDLHGTVAKVDYVGNPGSTFASIGIGAEYWIPGTSVSVFARADHTVQTHEYDDYVHTENRVLVGAKLNFGEGNLLDRDRSGASLKPIDDPMMPGHRTPPTP